MKSAPVFVALICLCVQYSFADDNRNFHDPEMDIDIMNNIDYKIVTYEHPFLNTEKQGDIVILDRFMQSDKTPPDELNTDCITLDSLDRMDMTIGQYMSENPGKGLFIQIDSRSNYIRNLLKEKEKSKLENKDKIATISSKWLNFKRQQNNDNSVTEEFLSEGKSQISVNKLIAGGSGSLDREVIFSFLFVEGNGPSSYDWTAERLNYTISKIDTALALIENEGERYGIKTKHRLSIVITDINYEPIFETSGIEFAPYVTIDGLDRTQNS